MNQLLIFYLLTNGINLIPMVIITLSIPYGLAIPFLPKKWCYWTHTIPNNGVAGFRRRFQDLDPDMKKYLIKFSVISSIIQVVSVLFISLGLVSDVPLPCLKKLNSLLSPDTTIELLMFMITTVIILLMPMILLFFALVYRIPLPFMSFSKTQPTTTRTEITHWEQQSQNIASIRLTRFENEEKIVFYANCLNEVTGAVFNLALCQAKGSVRTDCYLYDEEAKTMEEITPAPVTVTELEQIFNCDYE